VKPRPPTCGVCREAPPEADGYCARCRAVVAEVRAEGAAARAVPGTQLPLRGAP